MRFQSNKEMSTHEKLNALAAFACLVFIALLAVVL